MNELEFILWWCNVNQNAWPTVWANAYEFLRRWQTGDAPDS